MKGTLTISAGDYGISVEASLMFTNDWKDQHDINAIVDSLLNYEPPKKEEEKKEDEEYWLRVCFASWGSLEAAKPPLCEPFPPRKPCTSTPT